MKKFLIGGTIVDQEAFKWSEDAVTPSDIKTFLDKLGCGEKAVFEITSPGGSCTAGIAIANLIKQASNEGHPTTAHIIGIAASMASVIACACDSVQMDENAFMMIHNPWSSAEGDSMQLRKEADTLDKFKCALLSFYRSKFNRTDEELSRMMDAETWFTGAEAESMKFACDLIRSKYQLKAAACVRQLPDFNNTPQKAKSLFRLAESYKRMNEQEENNVETDAEAVETTPEMEKPAEEQSEGKEQEDMITKAEAEMRVSGMQSKMAKQIDALHKDYEEKISQIQDQLKAKDNELTEVKNQVISIGKRLEETQDELQKTASALEEKTNALASLNASVNTPNDELPTLSEGLAKCNTPSERSAFISSGKYKH